MPKKVKLFAAGVFLALVGFVCVALVTASAKAEEANSDQAQTGLSLINGGVMTIVRYNVCIFKLLFFVGRETFEQSKDDRRNGI